ncbi:MAG: FeoB-associated Cys-rich membrane protein [Desulfobaccales bacterium]
MSWTDLLLAGGIIAGALYLLYRSVWKKGGFCPGCTSGTCSGKREKQ